MSNIKVPIAALFLLLGLAVILGGQKYLHGMTVDKPMEAAMKAVNGVKDFEFKQLDGKVDVSVELGKVTNLEATYGQIEEIVVDRLGDRLGKVSVLSSDDGNLENSWYQMHYSVEEAASTGSYSKMRNSVDAISKARGVEAKIWVGDDKLYVQLALGNDNLYKVIPRNDIVTPSPSGQLEG